MTTAWSMSHQGSSVHFNLATISLAQYHVHCKIFKYFHIQVPCKFKTSRRQWKVDLNQTGHQKASSTKSARPITLQTCAITRGVTELSISLKDALSRLVALDDHLRSPQRLLSITSSSHVSEEGSGGMY